MPANHTRGRTRGPGSCGVQASGMSLREACFHLAIFFLKKDLVILTDCPPSLSQTPLFFDVFSGVPFLINKHLYALGTVERLGERGAALSSPVSHTCYQAAPRTPLLHGDWPAAGSSRSSNMAAPSGGVNCEEFAEFQVMRFSSCGRLVQPFVPRSCFVLWPGREYGQVVGKAGGSELFFRGTFGGHGG